MKTKSQPSDQERRDFIKKSTLTSDGSEAVTVRVLDGLQNLLPYGVGLKMQTERSTLLDAYKKNELVEKSGLGVFSLSAMIAASTQAFSGLPSSISMPH